MTDDQFEKFLQREARDYNAPPPVPRDAMWARIDAERRARESVPLSRGWRTHRWLMAGVAIAAMLLLGIGIGYVWRGTMDSRLVAHGPGSAPEGAHEQLAERGGARPGVRPGQPSGSERASEGGAGAREDIGPQEGVATQREGISATERQLAVAPSPSQSPSQAGSRSLSASATERRGNSAAFAAVTAEHLGRVETLLTSFRAESESGKVDPQITSWAGDLLGTTRLLLDSPGADDPRLHKLLGDLEIVLTQITQLSAEQGSTSDELQLIDQSLRSHDVMTRIRGATPAGAGALPIGT
jgi:hypothetical protein